MAQFANSTLADIEAIQDDKERADAMKRYDRTLKTQLLDMSRAVSSANSLNSVQSALCAIPYYSGNTPLKDFIQDVENFSSMFSDQPGCGIFLRGVLSRLQGRAKQSLEGKDIQTIGELVKHLKSRFAPRKTYGHYVEKLSTATISQGESIQDFYDRLIALIGAAATAADELIPAQPGVEKVDQKPQLELIALESFINGLPQVYKAGIASSASMDLASALTTAKNIARYMGGRNKESHAYLAFNRGDIMQDNAEAR